MEERIDELIMKKYGTFIRKFKKYEKEIEVRPEAIHIINQEIKLQEELDKQRHENMERIRIEKIKQDKEEEQQIQDKDKPLTLKDVRAFGFDYECSLRTLDELNVEILKRIVRREYSHKFKN